MSSQVKCKGRTWPRTKATGVLALFVIPTMHPQGETPPLAQRDSESVTGYHVGLIKWLHFPARMLTSG